MLLVPYSSTMWTMLARRPVRIEATTMATSTPMTIPSTVSALRNLCARTLSSAIRSVSRGMKLGSLIFIDSAARERDDRIEARGFECRIDTCDHADRRRDAEGQRDIAQGDRHRNWREGRHSPGDAGRSEQPQYTSKRAEHRRLDQKLQEHLFASRAESFTQTDLEGAFGDTDQHDVHDHDATHDEGDQGDCRHGQCNGACELINLAAQRFGVDETEVVFLAPSQLVIIAQCAPGILDRPLESLALLPLAVDLQIEVASINALKSR